MEKALAYIIALGPIIFLTVLIAAEFPTEFLFLIGMIIVAPFLIWGYHWALVQIGW
jgi:hypothetical protein